MENEDNDEYAMGLAKSQNEKAISIWRLIQFQFADVNFTADDNIKETHKFNVIKLCNRTRLSVAQWEWARINWIVRLSVYVHVFVCVLVQFDCK